MTRIGTRLAVIDTISDPCWDAEVDWGWIPLLPEGPGVTGD